LNCFWQGRCGRAFSIPTKRMQAANPLIIAPCRRASSIEVQQELEKTGFETHLRLFKKSLLFAAELVLLFLGFMFSMGFTLYLDSLGSKLAPVAFLLSFSLFSAALVWFRRKTGTWTMAADVTARIAHCSWRQLHPRLAKYLCILQRSFLWFPAARYGFTPIWFNHSIPSSGVFLTSDPQHPDGWNRPESELATGHATHLAVRRFQLGMITASCYEYRHTYNNPVNLPLASSLRLSCGNLFAPPNRTASTTICALPSSDTARTYPPSTTWSASPFPPTSQVPSGKRLPVKWNPSTKS
jgi:hypothetical protein